MELGFTYEDLGRPERPGSVKLPDMPSYIEAEIPPDIFDAWKKVKFTGCIYFDPMGGGPNDSSEYYMALSFGPC